MRTLKLLSFIIIASISMNGYCQTTVINTDPQSVVKEYYTQFSNLEQADSPDNLLNLISSTLVVIGTDGSYLSYADYKQNIETLYQKLAKDKLRNSKKARVGKFIITDFIKTITDNNTAVLLFKLSGVDKRGDGVKYITSITLVKEDGVWKISIMQENRYN